MHKFPNLRDLPNTLLYNNGSGVEYVAPNKNLVGLNNVDNTSDANKPVSTATQTALNLKENTSNRVTNLLSPNNTTYPTTQAVQDAIMNAQLGLIFQEPLEMVCTVGTATSPVLSPANNTSYLLQTGANTGVWSSFQPGDLVQYQDGSWVLIKSLTIGDRFGINFNNNLTPVGDFLGQKDKIVTITGGTPGAFTYDFQTPQDDFALLVDNPNAYFRNQVFVYSAELSKWVKISGGLDFSFGAGLQTIGTTVSTNIGVTDTNTLDLSSNGNTITGDVKISSTPGNIISTHLDGIYATSSFTETPLVATDSSSIDFTTSGTNGHNLTGVVKLSTNPNNILQSTGGGLLVTPPSQTPITVNDTNTVDLLVGGLDNHTISANVKVSSAVDNNLSINSDGLYLDVSDWETNTSLTYNNMSGVYTYTSEQGNTQDLTVVSLDAGNSLIRGSDGGAYYSTGALLSHNPQTLYLFYDFLASGAHDEYSFSNSGTGVNVSILSAPDLTRLGIIRITTGTVSTGRSCINGALTSLYTAGTPIVYECLFRSNQVNNLVDQLVLRLGFGNNATGEPANGIFLRYNQLSNNFIAVSRQSSNETAVDTGVEVVAGQWYKLRIETTDSVANFYLDGVLVATILSNIPTGIGQVFGWIAGIYKSLGVTTTSLDVDYILIQKALNR